MAKAEHPNVENVGATVEPVAADAVRAAGSNSLRGLRRQDFWTSPQFPAETGESFAVRDGRGRLVERWAVKNVGHGKARNLVTFDISGHRDTDSL